MVNGEAKEFGGDRMSFDVIEKGEGGDKEIKVRALVVLDSKVIYHQGKDDITRDVKEETGGGGLVEAVGNKQDGRGDGFERACLPPLDRTFTGGVGLDEG